MNWLNLFRFSGRAGREEFASVSLVMQLASCVMSAGGLGLMLDGNEMSLLKSLFLIAAGLVMIPVSVFLVWISVSVFFRRLHDFNWSGWWYIGYLILVTVGAFMWTDIQWLFTVLGLVLILFFSLKRAPGAANRFAPAAEPFFPAVFSGRPWVLGVIVAVTVVLSLVPLFMLSVAAASL